MFAIKSLFANSRPAASHLKDGTPIGLPCVTKRTWKCDTSAPLQLKCFQLAARRAPGTKKPCSSSWMARRRRKGQITTRRAVEQLAIGSAALGLSARDSASIDLHAYLKEQAEAPPTATAA